MRLRNVKGARETLASHDKVISNPLECKGRWKEIFGNNNPIHIEIGMGKGKFISDNANINPNINYIGIEKFSSVLVRALDKLNDVENSNLVYIRMDAELLTDAFDCEEVDRIYLNFSDPWPKDRHAKRRLTHQEFLNRYDNILKKDGEVIFKTDNRELFDFSLEQIKASNWKLKNVTYDLHNSDYIEGNVMTEYEQKFVEMGLPINRLVAYR